MKREHKMYKAYQKNPVPGITAEVVMNGICFKSEHEQYLQVIVYVDGTIQTPSGIYASVTDLGVMKKADKEMYKLVETVANDFKIMELRESCTNSLIYENSYDAEAVDNRMKDWEDTTGCLVCLSEEQKAAIFNELIYGTLFATTAEITGWLYKNHIPAIRAGKVSVTVDKADRTIMVDIHIDKYDGGDSLDQVRTFIIEEDAGLTAQFDNAMSVVCDAFGMKQNE